MSDRSDERPIVVRLLGERPFGGHSERVALWGVQGGIGLMTASVCLLFFFYNDRFGDPLAESFGVSSVAGVNPALVGGVGLVVGFLCAAVSYRTARFLLPGGEE